jgi:hypothetical protein
MAFISRIKESVTWLSMLSLGSPSSSWSMTISCVLKQEVREAVRGRGRTRENQRGWGGEKGEMEAGERKRRQGLKK